MGEWADDWSAMGVTNLWDAVPQVIETKTEDGAAGAIHGALTTDRSGLPGSSKKHDVYLQGQ